MVTPISTLVRSLAGKEIPSKSTGKRQALYRIESVDEGIQVVMSGGTRKQRSYLPWADIERVYAYAAKIDVDDLTTGDVDNLVVGNDNNWSSSTMLALILAMLQPSRAL